MPTKQVTNNINTKVCSICKKELHVVNFHKDGRSSDGFQNVCKICRKQQQRKESIKKEIKQNAMLNVRMSDSLKKKLKLVSMVKGCSVGPMVRDVVERWVDEELGL